MGAPLICKCPYRMKFRGHLILFLALLTGSAGAVAGGAPLTWRGDIATARGFVDAMARAFRHSGHAHVALQPFNTISALDQLSRGQVDIAGSARGRSPRRAIEQSLTFTPVAWDALVIVTSRHNPLRSITLKQLHDIYYGKIHNWRQVGGRNEPIHVYAVASPTDGIEYSLRKLLFGRGNQPVAAPRLYINVRSLEQGVALDPDGMGVSTLSGVIGNPKLKMLAIDGVRPSLANVADGHYPLYTPLYLVTRQDEHNASATAFVDFATSAAGQRVLRRHHLLPYADGTVLANNQADREQQIASAVGRMTNNGPTAAPGASYSEGASRAPTSHRTRDARDRMLDKRDAQERHRKAAQRSRAMNDGASGGGQG